MAKAVAKKKTTAQKPVKRSSAAKRTGAAKPAAAAKRAGAAKQQPSQAAATAVDAQVLAHGLNTLLHTMQTVQQFEESLCSLMHALRRGRATGPMMRELRDLLEQLPAQDYLHEVRALRDAIAA